MDKKDFPAKTLTLNTTGEAARTIGPYRLLQKVGEGGMGEVWVAEQQKPIHRRVALKLIKAGMDTKQVIARFESERQALAVMSHPNIAKVFDAGATEQGRPYFAMQYIRGEPITTYCDKHRLTTRERLELFMQICDGVQHAHHKGIIHRDIKPSNVLVAIQDDTPVPIIIDFGLAKATELRLTEKTLFTQIGVLVGTPAYMSPEQAEMSGMDVDTRTDVYSLGVLLYELLVGALPFDSEELRQVGFAEICRKIREEEPPKPSSRISSLGDQSGEAARRRRLNPRSLAKQLAGDLDWITMRALEKDRARRYASPRELAADIQRHLKHEPVQAGPPGAVYRFTKFINRHRTAAMASVSVLIALVLGIVATTSMYIRARTQRQEARWQSYVSSIRAASLAAKNGNVAELRNSLDACPPEYRRWEWDHLSYQMRGNRTKLDTGSWPWLTQAYFDSEGKKVIAFSFFTSRIHTWDARTFSLERTFDLLADGVREPSGYLEALSYDGRLAVIQPGRRLSVAQPKDVRPALLRLGEESKQETLLGSEGLYLACFSSSGNLVAIANASSGGWGPDGRHVVLGQDTNIIIYDTRSATKVASLETQHNSILSIAFDTYTRFLAIASEKKELALLEIRTGKIIRLEGQGGGPLAFSPDGHLLAATGNEEIRILDVDSRKIIQSWQAGEVRTMKFTPDGTRLIAAADNVLRLWNVNKGTPVSTWLTEEPVKDLSFSPDGKRFISTSNSAAYVWDTDSTSFGKILNIERFFTFSGPRREGDLSVGVGDGTMMRIDSTSGAYLDTVSPTEKPKPGSLDTMRSDIHPEGTHYVGILKEKGSIQVVPARNSAHDEIIKLGDEGIWKVKFSRDGRVLAAVFGDLPGIAGRVFHESEWKRDKFVRVFEWPSLRKLYEARLPENTNRDDVPLEFSPDSKILAVGNEIVFWDRVSPMRIKLTEESQEIQNIAFSANGLRIAGTISRYPGRNEADWRVREETETIFAIWDVSDLPQTLVQRRVDWFGKIVFSSDGSRLFSYSKGGIKVWDAAMLTPLISLESRSGTEMGYDKLSFDAFRQALVASTWEGEILVFRTR